MISSPVNFSIFFKMVNLNSLALSQNWLYPIENWIIVLYKKLQKVLHVVNLPQKNPNSILVSILQSVRYSTIEPMYSIHVILTF